MINDSDTMPTLSGSINELGSNAASYTWNNSKDYAANNPLLKTKDEISYARKYLLSLGASWTEEELSPEIEVQALITQLIAGDIREYLNYESYEEYEQASHNGQVSGLIFKNDDQYFYTLDV